MSRSPLNEDDRKESKEYHNAWSAIHALMEQGKSWSGRERHCCFLNTGGPRLANVSSATGFDWIDDGRGLALVDWDFDGDLDLWLSNRTAPRLRFLRNDNGSQNHFLAIRLVGNGTTTNRDAIGARVEVVTSGEWRVTSGEERGPQETRLTKSLRAGEGFLSQSTKWLHFGLGTGHEILKLVVHWPDRSREEIRGVRRDSFLRIVQGTARAERWTPPARPDELAAASPEPAAETQMARIVFPLRTPLPSLHYLDLRGPSQKEWNPGGTPTLINLWASSCVPCVKELKELADHYDQLRAANLEVLALSVDALGEHPAGDSQSARALANRLQLPFPTGFMGERFYDQLRLVYENMYADQRPLPVPTSLLVDGDGWITVVYRGPVSVEQLLSDVRLCSVSPSEYFRQSLPFEGRWQRQPLVPVLKSGRWGKVAQMLEVGGYRAESLRYWQAYLAFYAKVPRPEDDEEAQLWDGYLAKIQGQEVARQLASAGRIEAAITACRIALKTKPDFVAVRRSMALLLEKAGKTRQAMAEFESIAYDRSSEGLDASLRLAMILSANSSAEYRDGQRALSLAERACRVTVNGDPQSLDALAAAYAELGRFAEAAETATLALELAETAGSKKLAHEIAARRKLYQSNQPYRSAPEGATP